MRNGKLKRSSVTFFCMTWTMFANVAIVIAPEHRVDIQRTVFANELIATAPEHKADIEIQNETVDSDISNEPTIVFTPQEITRQFDVLYPSAYTKEDLIKALSTENHKKMIPYVDTLIQAEELYGVNAFYLLCKLGYESGWGRHMAGKNNIGGWTDGKGGFRDFASVDECILHIAENIATSYKDAVGSSLGMVSARYCPTDGYVEMLLQIMRERKKVIEK
ncbi:MAG: glucosaminidase domain-containing protein [Bacillota bacterium]